MLKLFLCIVFLGFFFGVVHGGHSVRSLTSIGSFHSMLENSPHGGIFVKFYAPWCGHCKAIAPTWESLAEKFLDSIAEVNCDEYGNFCRDFDIKGYPTLKWFSKSSSANSGEDYNGGRDLDSLLQYTAQKLGVHVPLPPTDVITADDSTFNQLVLRSPTHSFVEFYAPWCGHCKNLAPTWEKLATAFKNEPSVEIVKIDADSNRESTAPYEIAGFPTLKWFPAGRKNSPEEYESGHDLESLVAFVNEKAGTQRLADGSLNSEAGRVPALDDLAIKFVKASPSDRDSIRSEASAVTGVETGILKFYLLVMDRYVKNPDFVTQETVRIQRMLDSGSIAANKADEFVKRINILSAFASDDF